METLYLNTLTGQVDNYSSDRLDYGKRHFDENGNPLFGMQMYNYKPVISPIERIKYLENFGPIPAHINILSQIGGIPSLWPAPNVRGYINCIGLFRCFVLSSKLERESILIDKLGFDDSGVGVKRGDGSSYCVSQLLYKFTTEPTQIELYIRTDGSDEETIVEINIFNNSKMEELKIPINREGLTYMFFQIFADLNNVDLNKFNPNSMPSEYQIYAKKIFDIGTKFPLIDNLDVFKVLPLSEGNDDIAGKEKSMITRWLSRSVRDKKVSIFDVLKRA